MEKFDLISREALLKKAQALLSFDGKEVVWVRDDVLLAPTIDAVAVIRCQECKHCIDTDPSGASFGRCARLEKLYGNQFNFVIELDDFCSYGERRV